MNNEHCIYGYFLGDNLMPFFANQLKRIAVASLLILYATQAG